MSQPQPTGSIRTRTYSWTDPSATVAALAGRSGIEVLQGMLTGELPPPPIMLTLGIEPMRFEVGDVAFALEP